MLYCFCIIYLAKLKERGVPKTGIVDVNEELRRRQVVEVEVEEPLILVTYGRDQYVMEEQREALQ